MSLPSRRKGETKTSYARRCHWAGKRHAIIGRKLGWTKFQVNRAIFGK